MADCHKVQGLVSESLRTRIPFIVHKKEGLVTVPLILFFIFLAKFYEIDRKPSEKHFETMFCYLVNTITEGFLSKKSCIRSLLFVLNLANVTGDHT